MLKKITKLRKVTSPREQFEAIVKDRYLQLTYLESIEKVENYASEYLNKPKNKLRILDFGAAGGITKQLRPNWLTCDVRKDEGVDIEVSESMRVPLDDASLDVIYLQDTLHHLQKLDLFADEASRLLTESGLIICREPSWTIPAQLIWRFFHPEDFSLKRIPEFLNPENALGPMEGNQALAWYLSKSTSILDFANPRLLTLFKMENIGKTNGIAFLMSGGSNFSTSISRDLLIKVHRLESKSRNWLNSVAFSTWLVFKKISPSSEFEQISQNPKKLS